MREPSAARRVQRRRVVGVRGATSLRQRGPPRVVKEGDDGGARPAATSSRCPRRASGGDELSLPEARQVAGRRAEVKAAKAASYLATADASRAAVARYETRHVVTTAERWRAGALPRRSPCNLLRIATVRSPSALGRSTRATPPRRRRARRRAAATTEHGPRRRRAGRRPRRARVRAARRPRHGPRARLVRGGEGQGLRLRLRRVSKRDGHGDSVRARAVTGREPNFAQRLQDVLSLYTSRSGRVPEPLVGILAKFESGLLPRRPARARSWARGRRRSRRATAPRPSRSAWEPTRRLL